MPEAVIDYAPEKIDQEVGDRMGRIWAVAKLQDPIAFTEAFYHHCKHSRTMADAYEEIERWRSGYLVSVNIPSSILFD